MNTFMLYSKYYSIVHENKNEGTKLYIKNNIRLTITIVDS